MRPRALDDNVLVIEQPNGGGGYLYVSSGGQ
jgi:hypothetical protein